MRFDEGKCRTGAKWCYWKVLRNSSVAQIEVCRYCKKYARYTIRNGKMDNRKYYRAHIRDFCQPFGETAKIYADIYGHEAIKNLAKEELRKSRSRTNTEAMERDFDAYIDKGEVSTFYGGQKRFK